MKFSNCFIPTTKETPNDATLPSHQFFDQGWIYKPTGIGTL